MASPTFRSLSQNYQFTGSNNITTGNGSAPTGHASGDGTVMMVTIVRTSGQPGPGTVTGPTGGWTLEGSISITGTTYDAEIYVWSIRRGGSAPGFGCSWPTNQLYSETYVIAASGVVGTGSVLNGSVVFGTPGVSATVDPPSITTTAIETLLMAVGVNLIGWTNPATPPTGYTDRSSGGTFTTAIASKALATATSDNPSAFSAADSSDGEVGITFAFASVAAGGTTYDVTPSDTAVLTDAASAGLEASRSISDTLTISDSMSFDMSLNGLADDVAVTDTVSATIVVGVLYDRSASDSVSLFGYQSRVFLD